MPKHPDKNRRAFAIMAYEANFPRSEISSYTNISKTALGRLIRRSEKFQSGESSLAPFSRKPGSGRPKEMTEELKLQIRKVMEEEDEDVMKVSALYIWEKLPCLNGICLRCSAGCVRHPE